MPTRQPRRLAALLAVAVLAGCTGTTTPAPSATASPSPSATAATQAPDALEVYRQIAEDVAAIRGLDAPARTDPKTIDADELLANLVADFEKTNPDDQIRIGERALRTLGLLPEDASLQDIYLELQGSQVIGYYDPEVDELFIVSRSGSLGPMERLTYAHEFTHELQDHAFDLESLGLDEAFDEGDRALAVLGLVEGDAVSAQNTWMAEHLTPAELAEVAAVAADPEMVAVLARTPAILLETSFFPYTAGTGFVSTLLAQGGYDAVNAAYERPPESTEQVLHPDRYLAGEAPVEVELPADLAARLGAGWTLDAEDTLGELQLRVWLREGGLRVIAARDAADGWGGDRMALFGGPDGEDLIVLVTEWDDPAAATEFLAAAAEAADGLGLEASFTTSGQRVVIAIGASVPQQVLRDLAGVIEG